MGDIRGKRKTVQAYLPKVQNTSDQPNPNAIIYGKNSCTKNMNFFPISSRNMIFLRSDSI